MPKEYTRKNPAPILGNALRRYRCVNDAEVCIDKKTRGVAVIQSRCGFKPIEFTDGWFEETKRMVAAAYEVWRKKNHIPEYSHFGCAGVGPTQQVD